MQGATCPSLKNRRQLTTSVKRSLRELRLQLSLLNQRVGTLLQLRDVDLDCLDLLSTGGPLSPSALSRRSGVHPATLSGILDRLERGRWISRERDPSDRRGIIIRLLGERNAELLRLYGPMNRFMDEMCTRYRDEDLKLIADFLERTAEAGSSAVHQGLDDLASEAPASAGRRRSHT